MWTSIVVTAIGVWLMASPSLLGYGAPARINDWVVGPVIAMLGSVAIAEATRPVVRGALVAGLWLLVAPLVLGYEGIAIWNSIVTGLLIAVLSLVARPMDPAKYGGGWSLLWNPVLRKRMYGEGEAGDVHPRTPGAGGLP